MYFSDRKHVCCSVWECSSLRGSLLMPRRFALTYLWLKFNTGNKKKRQQFVNIRVLSQEEE